MKFIIAFTTLLLSSISVHAAAESPAIPLKQTTAYYSRLALLGMQLSIQQGKKAGEIPASLAQCVSDLPPVSLDPYFEKVLKEALNTNEQETAEQFFATDIGQKFYEMTQQQIYIAIGEKPTAEAPVFSAEERKVLTAFGKTSAGDKLFTQKVVQLPAAKKTIDTGIHAVISHCEPVN